MTGLGQRVAAAAQLGFRRVVARVERPAGGGGGVAAAAFAGLEVVAVRNVVEAVRAAFGEVSEPFRRRGRAAGGRDPRGAASAGAGMASPSGGDGPVDADDWESHELHGP